MNLLHIAITLLSFVSSDDDNFKKDPPDQSTVDKKILLQIVNATRKSGYKCGNTYYKAAPPVVWNDVLEFAALAHSADMDNKKFFSHTSSNGINPGNRLDEVGYKWKTFGENIAMGYQNERAVMESWLQSPGHCKNIMNSKFTEMGVARVGKYWTQEFGTK